MEISGNKYLHKKFKKQTNFPINNALDISIQKNNEIIWSQTQIENQNQTSSQTEDTDDTNIQNTENNKRIINNKDIKLIDKIIVENVPKLKSTNSEYNMINNVEKSNFIKKSSISANTTNTIILDNAECVSFAVISTSRNEPNSLNIINELKENHFNFDTCKSSNTNLNTQQIIYENKSSENVYSKYNLLSERPNNVVINDDKAYSKGEETPQEIVEANKKIESSNGGKYVCTYCNLACSKPSVLQKHIRAHTNERPYPCVSCGFSFKTRSNLYKHCRSRTHANRVMGNKHMQDSLEIVDTESQEKMERYVEEEMQFEAINNNQMNDTSDQSNLWEQKTKPYKPKFHTAQLFYEETKHSNDKKNDAELNKNQDLLKLRINELINKNNSIVNCDDAVLIRRKYVLDNGYVENQNHEAYLQNAIDEPLNLSAKNRKRCLSDSENAPHTTDKSLIKQLLLKNLNPDPDLQCQYCKQIFQSVPELEMHKLKYCSVCNKGNNHHYVRSSSVNVASILTQNKNYDTLQNSSLPLKSPGPFLGKTRLIENDKSERFRTFSFDDNAILHNSSQTPESPNLSKYMIQSPSFSPISPLKKNSVKLFGGEVKITQTSGETRSFKIESETSALPTNFDEYNSKLSENLVIKSSLGSGGTVLQSKPNYPNQKNVNLPSPNIIRYENTNMPSPNLSIPILNKNSEYKFDKTPTQEVLLAPVPQRKSPNARETHESPSAKSFEEKELYKSNLIDFSQKAIKLITPNVKPPNLTIPGLPVPMLPTEKIYSPNNTIEIIEKDKQHLDNLNFAKKQISLQQKMGETAPNMFNPVNLIVDGKVVRYVPGMPGPVEGSLELSITPKVMKSPKDLPKSSNESKTPISTLNGTRLDLRTPTIVIDQPEPQNDLKMHVISKIKMRELEKAEPSKVERTIPNLQVSPEKSKEEVRKFVRPNSLALKPSSVAFKQHHGLTPTKFNQALISPDTPRVAKKFVQQYLNGNYFSYLGLKSSTKSVYCTLNKTQPFYVKHFKKLSMYSEWRQQESKIDSLSVSAYDSRQRQGKYTLAGSSKADLIVHSSYKFVISEGASNQKDENVKSSSVPGGYESNEDYTYIRGRGRGRYVCDQCGIRCKKPSMLKKHLRTHSDDRPYTCEHCNFSFKTKGNLTKHMKSKAHTKKFSETSTPNTNSVTSSSEDEESDAESSDESTRLQEQEHEAAHCLLSLAQKVTPPPLTQDNSKTNSFNLNEYPIIKDDNFLKNPDQITQVNNTNFAKNKILNEPNLTYSKPISEVIDITTTEKQDNFSQYLGKTSLIRPLTYPYQKNIDSEPRIDGATLNNENFEVMNNEPPKSDVSSSGVIKIVDKRSVEEPILIKHQVPEPKNEVGIQNFEGQLPTNILIRKRKLSSGNIVQNKVLRPEEQLGGPINLSNTVVETPALDLSSPPNNVYNRREVEVPVRSEVINFVQKNQFLSVPKSDEDFFCVGKSRTDSFSSTKSEQDAYGNYECVQSPLQKQRTSSYPGVSRTYEEHSISENQIYAQFSKSRHSSFSESNSSETFSQNSEDRKQDDSINNPNVIYKSVNFDSSISKNNLLLNDGDQSAMQTLADIAIKQMKNEKNILAKNVASVYLKLATKNENSVNNEISDGVKKFVNNKESDLIVKSEENKSCTICSKNFSKPSQLRLHMNIHYLERPYRCESCSVSFRTKGHLQKHERSASHHNKLSSSPALSSSEPRPFKCTDCNIAFRIHGHLAKHLRSKMHIMKLECLAKIPFGLYAELERANSLLTEINTTDGELCLESLKILARKLFNNDPGKLDHISALPENRDS